MLDETDIRLLSALQKNAQLTAQDLGAELGLSPSQAGRRRQRLETSGLIRGYFDMDERMIIGLSRDDRKRIEQASHASGL